MNRQELVPNAKNDWRIDAEVRLKRTLFRPLHLTDCCATFSAILHIQPRPKGKCAKLAMGQLRDLHSPIDLQYVDNSCDLGDTDTKHDGSTNAISKFFIDGLFAISPIGRKAREALEGQGPRPPPNQI